MITLLGIMVLSFGLPDLELAPGRSVRFQPEGIPTDTPPSGIGFWAASYRLVLIFFGVLLPFMVYELARSPKLRRQFMVCLLLGLIALYILGELPKRPPETRPQPRAAAGQPLFRSGDSLAALPAHLPWWVVFLTSIGLSGLTVGLAVFLWKRYHRRPDPLKTLAREARQTLDDIKAGADFTERIIKFYYIMTRVSRRQRGIERQISMTTREFEFLLHRHGLPDRPVQTLTRLFEKVRYGGHRLDPEEETAAADSLRTIIRALRAKP